MNNTDGFKIEVLTHKDLHKYSHRLCQIFLDAFTTGDYAHNLNKLTPDHALSVMHSILGNDDGFGYAAFDRGKAASPHYPVGFVFGMSAIYDPLICQTEIAQEYGLKKCLYLAELAIDQGHKGRRIGQELVRAATILASHSKVPLIVRTNEHSDPLHKFYERCGFSKLKYTAFQAGSVEKRYFLWNGLQLDSF